MVPGVPPIAIESATSGGFWSVLSVIRNAVALVSGLTRIRNRLCNLSAVVRRFTPILRTVPLYDYECPRCGERFEARVGVSETPACPACGAPDPHRLPSAFAGPFTVGLRGAAARRSNASRRLREEQRRERRGRPEG